jgi:hypothetical protein
VTPAEAFLARLSGPEPLMAVELRPPRADLDAGQSMDSWLGMHWTATQILQQDTVLLVTDGAIGAREEENLHHLVANLEEDVSRARLCPFLTTKHSLEYCLWFAARAVEAGCPAVTVLGGDRTGDTPRCVPHGYLLRQEIRRRFQGLALGGWANPHQSATAQVGHLAEPGATLDFYLTQLVSHHDLGAVEAFLAEASRRGLRVPGVFGVFFYRSANPKTLERLLPFFPVPVEGIARDFASGLGPEEVCARTIRALRRLGVTRVYISNLHPDQATEQLVRIRALVEAG